MKAFNFFGLLKPKSFTELRDDYYSGRKSKHYLFGSCGVTLNSEKLEKKLYKEAKTQILTKEVIESEIKFLQEHIDWKKTNCVGRRMTQGSAGTYWYPVLVAQNLIKILKLK